MTPEFKAEMVEKLKALKEAGATPQQALRDLELNCARNSEEFRDGGHELVEEVYEGFISKSTGHFTPKRPRVIAEKVPVETTTTPIEELLEEVEKPIVEDKHPTPTGDVEN